MIERKKNEEINRREEGRKQVEFSYHDLFMCIERRKERMKERKVRKKKIRK
jgi:hypothetical protein